MTTDELNIKISIERFEKNLAKINDEIRNFVSKLKTLCDVKDYNLIRLKFKGEKNEKCIN